MKFWKIGIFAILFVFILTSCGKELTMNRESVLFEIKKGESVHAITKHLKIQKIISSTTRFEVLAKLTHKDNEIKYGVYQIDPKMDYLDLLDLFYNGQTYSIRMTIPEGFNKFQIADLLEEKQLAKKADFLSLCTNRDFINELGISADSLEGYLYPDTYLVPLNYDTKGIVRLMIDNFRKNINLETLAVIKKNKMDLKTVLIMASIVEREAQQEFERPIIAGVYYNRLKIGMLLEADPTLIYGLQIKNLYTGDLKFRDFDLVSPYNTYRIAGLPPTPIANPGKGSILAAIYPAKVDYLFFVSKNDGTHQFSKTREEHNAAVYQYQKLPAVERRKATLKEGN